MGSKSFTNKVVGIFSDRTIVDSVLSELNSSGFDRDDISVLARDFDENSDRIVTHSSTTYPDTELRDTVITDDDVYNRPLGSNTYPTGTVDTTLNNNYSTGRSDFGTGVRNTVSDVGSTLRSSGQSIGDSIRERDLIEDDNNYDEVHDVMEKDPKAMVKGATAGGALGLIAGLGLLMIPGIGPVLAAGPLAAALTAAAGGAAIGATAGTLLGLLKDEGIPNDRADFYNRHFNKGDVLIMVHTDEGRSSLAREILVRFNPDTIDTF